ncbi:MAG: TolC family protein [Myxococcaceae bacterium]|nr:TolC family protein [Myxococcaceae bacterium]
MTRVGLLVLLSTASLAHATTLKELLEAADKQNVDRRISVEQRERAAAEARQAWTALLPAFTASGAWTHNQYEVALTQPPVSIVITPKNQFDGTLRVDLPLIDATRWARTSAAIHASEAAEQRDLATADQVRRQVVGAWFGYAAALKVRESAQRSVGVAEAQLKLQEVREKAGTITELELARSRAEVQRNRQILADAENLVAVSKRSLETLTGIAPNNEAPLPEDDLTPEPGFEELEKNVDTLPAVRAAEKDVQAASNISTAAKLTAVPVVGAQFTERLTNATGFSGQTASYNAGLNLTWRLEVQAVMAMDAQSHAHTTALLASERTRLAARDLIYSDWQRLKAALIKVQAAQAQVEAARRADQVAHDRYAVGAATQIDVIQAERDLFGAEVGQIQARTELASARLSLRLSSGRPLFTN